MSPGRFLPHTFQHDGGRQVTVDVPPTPPEAIVYAADGERIAKWGPSLEKTAARSTMIVGVHGHADETSRLQEYSPVFNPLRFAAHERFFVNETRHWVESTFRLALPKERTAILGASAGGELALALGLRHPQVYGTILCASPGAGYKPPAVMPSPLPRVYLLAGTEEPFFLQNAIDWNDAFRNAGADVVMHQGTGSHGGAFWEQEFPRMLEWASQQ